MQQPKILVAIRKRPLSKKEQTRGETDIVTVKNDDTVIISEYKQKVDLTKFLQETIFNFDYAFHEENNNEEIYDLAVRPLVDSAFQGAKVTCFAYGQTGSGKTYTMNGNNSQGNPGLYTLGAQDIFYYLENSQFKHLKAKLSFYEIYCGKLFDLLNKRNELKLREDNKNNINIIGLEEATVTSTEQFIDYLALGSQQRVTSQNSANADSSRSHAILQISLKDGKKLHGKISFIDLAGNERGADHMDMDKQTRIDGAQINKSLLSLKQCIRALDQGKQHIPFRGSKLTMVLKDSFIGFCRTVMIGNVSPSSASSQNTLNTLRYADRVKQLRKPQEGVSKEDQKAKQLMLPRQTKNAIRIAINNDDDADDIAKKRQDAQKQYGIVGDEQSNKKAPAIKQEFNPRKNSMGGLKSNTLVRPQPIKSTSVAKNNNFISNKGSTNNIVPTQAIKQPQQAYNNQLNNPMNGNSNTNPMKRSIGGEYQMMNSNTNGNRFINSSSSQHIGFKIQKQQPMEIQSGAYYLPKSNANMKMYGNNQPPPRGYQQSNNFSNNLSGNYSSLSQNQNLYQNYSTMNINPTNQYRPQYGQYQKQANQFEPNSQYNSVNLRSNPYGQPQNMPNKRQILHMQPMPQKWQDMVNKMSSSTSLQYNQRLFNEMNNKLLNEQNELIQQHSATLKNEIQIIKSEMNLLNTLQIQKSKISSRSYVRYMQQSIEQKISILELLREKLINFTYKLDDIQQIEKTNGSSNNIDDEQLLDDIN